MSYTNKEGWVMDDSIHKSSEKGRKVHLSGTEADPGTAVD